MANCKSRLRMTTQPLFSPEIKRGEKEVFKIGLHVHFSPPSSLQNGHLLESEALHLNVTAAQKRLEEISLFFSLAFLRAKLSSISKLPCQAVLISANELSSAFLALLVDAFIPHLTSFS